MHIDQINLETTEQHLKAVDVVWVNSNAIGFYKIPVPEVPKRRWQEVLPWTIDDQSLFDPEQQHIVAIEEPKVDKDSGEAQQLTIVAIPVYYMETWKDLIESLNYDVLEGKPWCPDVFALPLNENGWSIWQRDEDSCLVRMAQHSGFVIEPEVLQSMLNLIDKTDGISTEKPASINIYRHSEALPDTEQTAFDVNLSSVEVNWLSVNDLQWPFNESKAVVNLLQGAYKPVFNFRKKVLGSNQLSPSLALVASLLLCGLLWLNIVQVKQQQVAFNQQVDEQLSQFFTQRFDPRISRERWLSSVESKLEIAIRVKSKNLWSTIERLDTLISQCRGKCQLMNINASGSETNLIIKGEEDALEALRKRLTAIDLTGFSLRLPASGQVGTLKVNLKRLDS